MYRDMTREDLAEWEALYVIDPWGEQRADLRAGIVASCVCATVPKHGPVPSPGELMPYLDRPKRKQSAKEVKAVMGQVKAAWGDMNWVESEG
jgi:hypothetical protein